MRIMQLKIAPQSMGAVVNNASLTHDGTGIEGDEDEQFD